MIYKIIDFIGKKKGDNKMLIKIITVKISLLLI